MTHARTASLVAACAAAALLVSACGGDTGGTASPAADGTTTTTTTSQTTTSSSAAAKPGGTAGGDVTAPGTELKIGDRAVVPFKYGTEKTGTIALTVTAIEQGDNADLAKFGDKAAGITPFYIRVVVENVGGTDLAHSSLSLRGLGEDGRGTGVIISGDTDRCESETAGRGFTTAGAKYETCVLQAAPEGSKIVSASYANGDGYDKDPVVWKG